MTKSPRLSNAAANVEVDAVSALLNAGYLDIYSGVQPATPDISVTTQVLLASLRFGTPAFAAGSGGIAVAFPITADPDAAATGTAAWYRCFMADHLAPVMDGSVGTSGANMNLTSVGIQVHSVVTINSFTLTPGKV